MLSFPFSFSLDCPRCNNNKQKIKQHYNGILLIASDPLEVFVYNVLYTSLQSLLIIYLDEDDEIVHSAPDITNYFIDK